MAEKSRGFGDTLHKWLHPFGWEIADSVAEWVAQKIFRKEACDCPNRRNRLNRFWPYGEWKYPTVSVVIPTRDDWYGFHQTFHGIYSAILAEGLEKRHHGSGSVSRYGNQSTYCQHHQHGGKAAGREGPARQHPAQPGG